MMAGGPKVFLDYDQQELDDQYNQRILVPDAEDYIAEARSETARVRKKMNCRIDVAYGPLEDQKLDVYPADAPGSPVGVYMHGGAWTRSDKAIESSMAESFVGAGAAYVAVNFSLCPKVSLDELIRQAREGVVWSYHNAASFNGDADRMFILGHSSGGHVGGMMAVTDWASMHGLPRGLIKGAMLCSGMYDLTPVKLSARNEYLKLDDEAVERNSPMRQIPQDGFPLVVGYGEGEHKEFRRQSKALAATWRERGFPVEEIDRAGVHHFSLRRDFNNPNSSILKATFAMMSL